MVRMYVFSGKVLIPNTRKVESLPPTRVMAESQHTASKDLANLLNEKFAKDLPHGSSFGANWALLNLQWQERKLTLGQF